MNTITVKINSSKPLTYKLGELAALTKTTLQGNADVEITGVGAITHAKKGEITFLGDKKYTHLLSKCQASALIITPAAAPFCSLPALICEDPKLTFAQIVQILYPFQTRISGIHETAIIPSTCEIHPSSYIGPGCVLGQNVKIGENVTLEAGCIVGDNCQIGQGTLLHPKVILYQGCTIGNDCTIHSGVVIGSDGFGYVRNKSHWLRVPQIGNVKIGNRTEIGANTTIDRGAIDDTEIGDDVILDNLIQIGHNVKIGDGTAIAACCGIAGSTQIGKNCMIGGGTRINGHITLADNVIIIGCSNVAQSINEPSAHGSAITTTDMKTWKKNLVRFHQLDKLALRLKALERKIDAQEET